MSSSKILLVALILSWAALGQARQRPFIDEPSLTRENVEDGTPWQEGAHRLPAYPQDGDLVAFQVDAPAKGLSYFLDSKTLEIGPDGVVRYSLVIKSGSGAANVSFEGMRCDTWDVKVYAYGIGGGDWKPVADAGWERIRRGGPYRHHLDLHEFYFCETAKFAPVSRDEILRRMRAPLQRKDGDRLY